MKQEIIIPPLGESIAEVTIGQLLVQSGQMVKEGDELVELETDKVNHVLYAPQGGVITWHVQSGDRIGIDGVIGEIVSAAVPVSSSPHATSAPLEERSIEKKTEPPQSHEEKQLPLSTHSSSMTRSSPVPLPLSQGGETRRPMSSIRRVIAQRLVQAQQTMAVLTTFNEIDMSHIMALRQTYGDTFLEKYGVKLGYMSFFVKAVVEALDLFPLLNAYIEGDEIVQRSTYDIGIAVGTEEGVIVPVLRDCAHLNYAQIEQAIAYYAQCAREGNLSPDDLQGGGFTITNGGIYGSLLSTPLVLPSQCAILGMHRIEKRVVVLKDQMVIRPMMYVALSYDHRLIDGKEAVSFLVRIKQTLEESARLLLHL